VALAGSLGNGARPDLIAKRKSPRFFKAGGFFIREFFIVAALLDVFLEHAFSLFFHFL